MYVSAEKRRSILTKILQDLPEERKKLLEEESQLTEPEFLTEPSPTSTIFDPEPLEKEKTPISDFMLKFEDKLFAEYENTSNYHVMRKPQEPIKSSSIEPLDPSEEAFHKRTMKDLVSIMSDELLEESELYPKVIRLDSPSTTIHCQINKDSFDDFNNLVVGVNIMSLVFAHDLSKDMPLASTTKLLKSLSGHIVPSLRILCVLPILVNGTKVQLNFYIFDVIEFDLLIGQPIERLIYEGKKGKLNIKLGKNFELSVPITHSLNAKIEPIPELDPMRKKTKVSYNLNLSMNC
jgi:hypothetical protein